MPTSYTTKNATICMIKEEILRIDITPDALFDREDMSDLISGAQKIGQGKKFRNLIVVGKGAITDTEARVLSASVEGSKYKIADAFVIDSLGQQLIMNIYIKLQKPHVPTRFFFDEDAAIEWLSVVS